MSHWTHALALLIGTLAMTIVPTAARAGEPGPIPVRIERDGAGYRMLRGGEPYEVRGVGGSRRLELLAEVGGNSFRTWGAQQLDETRVGPDGVERPLLDHAHHLGLTVAVGFWLEHERHGFDYTDTAAVQKQLDELATFVRRFKDHPAILVWGVGNEVEIGSDNPERVFRAIETAAKLVKSIDPHHPVMAVTAEIGDDKASMVQRLCPSVDLLGINSYGGLSSLADRLRAQGVDKPYLVTEYGRLGHWETGSTPWGAPYEQTSSEKASFLREGYERSIAGSPACLGGYAFLWGNKQERTHTWYGMFLDSGEKTEAVDALAQLWTGKTPANRAPTISRIEIHADGRVFAPGAPLGASVRAEDADRDTLRYEWEVLEEATDLRMGGDNEAKPPKVSGLIQSKPGPQVRLETPDKPGAYRLFVTVYDDHGGAATANVPFRVE